MQAGQFGCVPRRVEVADEYLLAAGRAHDRDGVGHLEPANRWVGAVVQVGVEDVHQRAPDVDDRLGEARRGCRRRIRVLGRQPGDLVVNGAHDRVARQDRDPVATVGCTRCQRRQVVDRAEEHVHVQARASAVGSSTKLLRASQCSSTSCRPTMSGMPGPDRRGRAVKVEDAVGARAVQDVVAHHPHRHAMPGCVAAALGTASVNESAAAAASVLSQARIASRPVAQAEAERVEHLVRRVRHRNRDRELARRVHLTEEHPGQRVQADRGEAVSRYVGGGRGEVGDVVRRADGDRDHRLSGRHQGVDERLLGAIPRRWR